MAISVISGVLKWNLITEGVTIVVLKKARSSNEMLVPQQLHVQKGVHMSKSEVSESLFF
ncbi:MAG: hypothetical protein PHH30_10125 [Bacteroidales bacterium]|nr:hypothetical protein [Bacteroidales bacterium]